MKTVVGVRVGDQVTANHVGANPNVAVTGRVIRNDEEVCIIRKEDGLTATIFGDIHSTPARRWPGVRVKVL